jgi:hypothetical protein
MKATPPPCWLLPVSMPSLPPGPLSFLVSKNNLQLARSPRGLLLKGQDIVFCHFEACHVCRPSFSVPMAQLTTQNPFQCGKAQGPLLSASWIYTFWNANI